jgi:hypothetical protein
MPSSLALIEANGGREPPQGLKLSFELSVPQDDTSAHQLPIERRYTDITADGDSDARRVLWEV